MKTLILLAFLTSASLAVADNNLLENGDFANGINHWEGDVHSADSTSSDSPFDAQAKAGVVVKLRSSDWTQVTQDFKGKVGDYLLTITYSMSPDLKFSDKPDDYTNIPGKLGYSRLRGFDGHPGEWDVIINDLGAMHYKYWKITPNPNAPGAQVVKVVVQLDSDDTEPKGFYLTFPPGQGLITLQNISLVPQPMGAQ